MTDFSKYAVFGFGQLLSPVAQSAKTPSLAPASRPVPGPPPAPTPQLEITEPQIEEQPPGPRPVSILSSPRPLLQPSSRGPEMRAIDDIAATRAWIFDKVLQAASSLAAQENDQYRLELRDVKYRNSDEYTPQQYKDSVLRRGTLSRPLVGRWVLTDKKTGKIVDQRSGLVARVPYLTDNGTFLYRGSQYALGNQTRLRPGIFVRRKENEELEAHVNAIPGKGTAHRYRLDPETGIFWADIRQANIPLAPALLAMGVTREQMEAAWGKEIAAANLAKDNAVNLGKFRSRLIRKPRPGDSRDDATAVREELQRIELDPEVMAATLGTPFKRLTGEAMLATTNKLLAVSRGEVDTDDRDHLAFQEFFGPEDLFAERIAKDYGRTQRQIFRDAAWSGSLKKMPTGALSKQLASVILKSGLATSLEEINPADILDKISRVSRMGEGGIPSVESIPDEARALQPSHYGFFDGVRTPESLKAGVEVFIASSVRKGRDGRLYAPFRMRDGKIRYITPQQAAKLTVGFPDSYDEADESQGDRVLAIRKGKLERVRPSEVEATPTSFEDTFSALGNLTPLKQSAKSQRTAMASRMLTQALALVGAQAPLVRTATPDSDGNESYEERYGRFMGAVRGDIAGVVSEVTPTHITVRGPEGKKKYPLHQNTPFNRKSLLHNTPVVEVGQEIVPGQLLARSNFTDDTGAAALGANVRTAYLPALGSTFEDAMVISESASKIFTSDHAYQHRLDYAAEETTKSKAKFLGLFPGVFQKKQLDTLDDRGVARPGTIVREGDPLVVAAVKRPDKGGRIHRRDVGSYRNASITWDHPFPGEVVDSINDENGATVVVRSSHPLQVGDKLSGRYGDKGVVAEIWPDDKMPVDSEGRPYHLLLGPTSIPSRVNPSQMIEAVLGKVAEKRGKHYNIPDNVPGKDRAAFALAEAEKYGISDIEDVIDPETGNKIPAVFSGIRFIMKLHHTADSKVQGRSTGGYTQDDQPAKGGSEGSKMVSLLDGNAILSHGATAVLRDASVIRGQSNPDLWLAFMNGQNMPEPRVPHIYKKWIASMKGAGVNVIPGAKGQLQIMAMSRDGVDELVGNNEVTSEETMTVRDGKLVPIPGGLFDPKIVGPNGDKWAFVRLNEPVLNPVMEEPVRRLLGLTEKQFRAILAGREELPGHGTGIKALRSAFENYDVDREAKSASENILTGPKSKRDAAVRKLHYLRGLQRTGQNPDDWFWDKVPVLPAVFRPISLMSDSGTPLVSDPNYLYREMITSNRLLKEMAGQVDDVGDERLALYDSVKAITGLGDPLHPKLKEKRVRGLLQHVFGDSPKRSMVQRRLLSGAVDMVGRASITPDPDLDMDQVAIPEEQAWKLYKVFVTRRLRQRGFSLGQAMAAVSEKSEPARRALMAEMEHRPVIINRAPVLHRFGVMAFRPTLTADRVMKVSPLIVSGFGADFDGDAMQFHVPASDDARKEALELMLPSRNLLSPADFSSPVHKISQEYLAGLYSATKDRGGQGPVRKFPSRAAAMEAFQRGEISVNTRISYPE